MEWKGERSTNLLGKAPRFEIGSRFFSFVKDKLEVLGGAAWLAMYISERAG